MALNERFTSEAEELEGAQSFDTTNKEEYSLEGSLQTHLPAPLAGVSGWSSKAIADHDALHETETGSTEVLVTLHTSWRDHNRNGGELENTLASQDTIHTSSAKDLQPADEASAGEKAQDDVAEGKAANDTPSPAVERPYQLLGADVSPDEGSQSQRRRDDSAKSTESSPRPSFGTSVEKRTSRGIGTKSTAVECEHATEVEVADGATSLVLQGKDRSLPQAKCREQSAPVASTTETARNTKTCHDSNCDSSALASGRVTVCTEGDRSKSQHQPSVSTLPSSQDQKLGEDEQVPFDVIKSTLVHDLEVGATRNTGIVGAEYAPAFEPASDARCGGRGDARPGSRLMGDGVGLGDDVCGPFFLSKQRAVAGRASTISHVLHVILTLAVFVLVGFAKAGNGMPSSVYGKDAADMGGPGYSGRRSTKGGKNSGGEYCRRSSGLKRRRSGSRSGFCPQSTWLALLRGLRAAWSKLWHATERDLATRWRAAGQALATLRQAWASLWLPRPHPEADVLAEALAHLPRSRRDGGDRPGHAAGGKSSGHGRRRRRRPGRGARKSFDADTGLYDGGSGELCASRSGADVRRAVGLKFLQLCGYQPLPGVGSGRGFRSPKYLLVLDLDETLVHCSDSQWEPSRRRRRGYEGGGGVGITVRPDLRVEVRGPAPSYRPACMYAWKRPHLDLFLGVVSRWYEIAIFTSGSQCFAEPLIDLIDPSLAYVKRFYRDSCTRRESTGVRNGGRGQAGSGGTGRGAGGDGEDGASAPAPGRSETVKDLSVLNSEHFPVRTVLVDNQPRTVVQQANVLPVTSWYPNDLGDRQLLELLPVLLALTTCRDVRSVLRLRPGVSGPDKN